MRARAETEIALTALFSRYLTLTRPPRRADYAVSLLLRGLEPLPRRG